MNYIYSDSLDEMVIESFYWRGRHYTWHDADCVYYNDDVDTEDYWMTVPDDAY